MVQLFPMNNGQYGGSVTLESEGVFDEEGGSYIVTPAAWPPNVIDVSIGPSATFFDVSSGYEYTADPVGTLWDAVYGVWPPLGTPAPDSLRAAGWFSHQIGCLTFDVSGIDVDAMDELVLTIDIGTFGGGVWIFGMSSDMWRDPSDPMQIGVSPHNWSSTTAMAVDWMAGAFDDLADFEAMLTAKAQQWPFNADAATVNLLDFAILEPPGQVVGSSEPVIRIPLQNWRDIVRDNDWVSLVFGVASIPQWFWMYEDRIMVLPDATEYNARNWITFNDQAFFVAGNPVTGVWLDVVMAEPDEDDPRPLPDIAISATARLGIDGPLLRVGGLAESPVDRPILSHAARRRRGW